MANIQALGELINWVDVRNKGVISDNLLGINIDKFFMPSVANIIGTDLSSYKLIRNKQFACNPMHVGRDEKMPIALYMDDSPSIVSPAYFVFEVKDGAKINPEYLMLWFRRAEFDRECWYHTDGSVRGGITWDEILEMAVPVPSIEEQNELVKSYRDIGRRIQIKKEINDNLESQARTIFHRYFIQDNDEKQYKAGTFNDLVLETVGGDWGDAETTDSTKRTRVRCIRGADIPAINLGCFAGAPIRSILDKNFEQKHLISNDIIIEISGGSPTQSTGRIAYISDEVLNRSAEPFICSNFCRVLRIKGDYFCYVVQYWQYLYRNGRMFTYENSSTGLKNFDLNGFLTEEEIPIPPIEIVTRFQKEVLPIYREIRANGIQIEHLERTMPNILPMMLANLSR